MLRTVMFFIIILRQLFRIIAAGIGYYQGELHLPVFVVVLFVAGCLYALALVILKVTKQLRTRALVLYFVIDIAVTLLGLLYVSISAPVSMSIYDMFSIGMFWDVFLDVIVILISFRSARYIKVDDAPIPKEKKRKKELDIKDAEW